MYLLKEDVNLFDGKLHDDAFCNIVPTAAALQIKQHAPKNDFLCTYGVYVYVK